MLDNTHVAILQEEQDALALGKGYMMQKWNITMAMITTNNTQALGESCDSFAPLDFKKM